ncbi:hypothetical protein [Methanocaldococcus fervens]|uniref:DUF2254 domain-containing protein n=1 Tax=Methanocaldococcus fervens (strain DSM 4213 / JCM 15782 / AG86) TaxID=573064 RepID=C7P8L4_METFA|nr:hypothetical protein [Methanocaldococcus fervens]ACV24896.1 hypothetical protein Mefer_1085 [Methanocaldococcus fervens AG86]
MKGKSVIKSIITIVGIVISAITATISSFTLFLTIISLFIITLSSKISNELNKLSEKSPYTTLILAIILFISFIILVIYLHYHFIGDLNNYTTFLLFAFATIFYIFTFGGFKEEISEIFDWCGIKTFQTTFQNYLFILSMIASIAIILAIKSFDSLLSLANNHDSSNFLTVGGILATISALLVSISWVIIQTSSDRLSTILMWMWIRDVRFLTFVIISFATVFLLIIISLTHVQLYVIDYGIIYYIIMLNFLMYSLYITAFAKVINPKHAVDLILRNKDIGDKSEDYDLKDAESRLFAVYEIIKKRIEAKDVYAVIKCLNKIYNNFDKYWMFIEDEKCEKYLKDFLGILKKLRDEYNRTCVDSPYYEKSRETFDKIIIKIYITLFDKTLEEKIKSENIKDIEDYLNKTKNNIDNYEMFKNKACLERFMHHLNELLKKYEKEKNENRLSNEIFNKLKEGLEELTNKCKDKLKELESQNNKHKIVIKLIW